MAAGAKMVKELGSGVRWKCRLCHKLRSSELVNYTILFHDLCGFNEVNTYTGGMNLEKS